MKKALSIRPACSQALAWSGFRSEIPGDEMCVGQLIRLLMVLRVEGKGFGFKGSKRI